MNRVFLPLTFKQGLFSQQYKKKQLLKDDKSNFVRVYLYQREIGDKLIVVKTMPNEDESYKVLRISDFVNEILRKEHGLTVFVETYGYVLELNPYEPNLPEGVFEGEYFIYLATEYIPYTLTTANLTRVEGISVILELLCTVYLARELENFHHGDIHKDNVLLDKVAYPRRYTIGMKTYVTQSIWMPRLIDFGARSTHTETVTKTSDLRSIVNLVTDIRTLSIDKSANWLWSTWLEKLRWKSHLGSFGNDSNKNFQLVGEVLKAEMFEPFMESSSKRLKLRDCIGCESQSVGWKAGNYYFCSTKCYKNFRK